jgi:hypothetical protein
MRNAYKIIALLVFATSAQAELVCKGAASGLNSIYIFEKSNGRNLSLNEKTYMKGTLIEDVSGVAKYSSTVKFSLAGKESVAESYYTFLSDENSYTELIGISADMKLMARSRPDPISDNGNYIKFTCTGSP